MAFLLCRFVTDSKAAGPDEATGGFVFVPHTCRFLGQHRAGRRKPALSPSLGVASRAVLRNNTARPDEITPAGSMSSVLLHDMH
jgi:hypothetical protein